MDNFYIKLVELGIKSNNFFKKIFKLKENELEKLINEATLAYSSNKSNKSSTHFNFIANDTLSGGLFPCSSFDCRFRNIDMLARNSILYADTVYITNPFEKYTHRTSFDENTRNELCQDLAIFYYILPLLEKNIFKFCSPYYLCCHDCFKDLKQNLRSNKGRIIKAEKDLAKQVLENFECRIEYYSDSTPYIDIEDKSGILEHPMAINFRNEHLVKLKK